MFLQDRTIGARIKTSDAGERSRDVISYWKEELKEHHAGRAVAADSDRNGSGTGTLTSAE